MEIFDTHTHLNTIEFEGRVKEEISKAQSFGVTKINNVGSNYQLNDAALLLDTAAEEYLLTKGRSKKVIAVGEIGLDYHWMVSPKEVQERVFRRQIQISKELGIPFQVHTRDALSDTYEIIKSEGVGTAGAIMHSFSGTAEEALKFVELGMNISFSGVVTFKKALDVQEAARLLPLDKILVETDAPYLTPTPYRGKENTPGYTKYVVEKIADLRGISMEEVAEATNENALKIFDLKK